MKNAGAVATMVACLAMHCVAVPATAADRTIVLTPAQLTDALRGGFARRTCFLGLVCATLSDPKVRLVDGDPRLYVQARVQPEVPGAPVEAGRMEVRAVPRFEPADGTFHADGAELVSMDFPGLSPRYHGTAGDLTQGLLAEVLRSRPVYTLDERDGRQALARLVLRGVRVVGGRLQLVLGNDEAPARLDEDPGPTRSPAVSTPSHARTPR